MSVDYNSGVVLGLTLAEIGFKIEKLKEKFEIHDKKGNPTGKFGTETTYKLSFNGEEKVYDDLYLEYVEEMLEPYLKSSKTLSVFNLDYEDVNSDSIIVGKKVVKRGYDDWNVVKEIPMETSDVYDGLKSKFNIDKMPKFYFYFYAG